MDQESKTDVQARKTLGLVQAPLTYQTALDEMYIIEISHSMTQPNLLLGDAHSPEWFQEDYETCIFADRDGKDQYTLTEFAAKMLAKTDAECLAEIDSRSGVMANPKKLRLCFGTYDLQKVIPVSVTHLKDAELLAELYVHLIDKLQDIFKCEIEVCEPLNGIPDMWPINKKFWFLGKPFSASLVTRNKIHDRFMYVLQKALRLREHYKWTILTRPSHQYMKLDSGYELWPELLCKKGYPFISWPHGLYSRRQRGEII